MLCTCVVYVCIFSTYCAAYLKCLVKKKKNVFTTSLTNYASLISLFLQIVEFTLFLPAFAAQILYWNQMLNNKIMDWHILIFVLRFSSTSPQVCRGWNQAFHLPELWRCFEFELNQPASSYLKATHPDLIKQIIKRHSNHLQYVSFKVWSDLMTMTWFSTHSNNRFFFQKKEFHLSLFSKGGQQPGISRGGVWYLVSAGQLFSENTGAHLHSQA